MTQEIEMSSLIEDAILSTPPVESDEELDLDEQLDPELDERIAATRAKAEAEETQWLATLPEADRNAILKAKKTCYADEHPKKRRPSAKKRGQQQIERAIPESQLKATSNADMDDPSNSLIELLASREPGNEPDNDPEVVELSKALDHLRLACNVLRAYTFLCKNCGQPMHPARGTLDLRSGVFSPDLICNQCRVVPESATSRDDLVKRIWEMHLNGKTQEEIAEALGVNQSTVSRIVRKTACAKGIPLKSPRQRATRKVAA